MRTQRNQSCFRLVVLCLILWVSCLEIFGFDAKSQKCIVNKKQAVLRAWEINRQLTPQIRESISRLVDNAIRGKDIISSSGKSRAWHLYEQITRVDTTGTFQNYQMLNYYYNTVNPANPDSISFSVYPTGISDWVPAMVYNLTWDATGEYLSQADVVMIVFGIRINLMTVFYQYDESHRLVASHGRAYDPDAGEWYDLKANYLYYENGYLSQMIIMDGTVASINELYKKIVFLHDAENRIMSQYLYCSEDSLDWDLYKDITLTYHANDVQNGESQTAMLSHSYPLDYLLGNPVNYGMLVEQYVMRWLSDACINDQRDIYVYDTENRLSSINTENWLSGGGWQNTSRVINTFDLNNNLSGYLVQNWNDTTNIWEDSLMVNNTWEQYTGTNENTNPAASNLSLTAYPSPFSTNLELTVQSKLSTPVKIKIFNMKGQCVYTQKTMPGVKHTWNAVGRNNSILPSGMYFIQVHQGKDRKTLKTLKLN